MSDGSEWILHRFTRDRTLRICPTTGGPLFTITLTITMLPPCHINVAHLPLRYCNIDPYDHLIALCN